MSGTRISIERGTAKPLYRQLREALEHEIAVGAVDPSQPLPSLVFGVMAPIDQWVAHAELERYPDQEQQYRSSESRPHVRRCLQPS
jgi:hypothetical protein